MNLKNGKSLTYGQLATKAAQLQVPQNPTLKKQSEFIYMGKSMPRVDIPDKISGKAVFGQDVELPDLHYAVLARPPAYNAKHESFDAKAATSSHRHAGSLVPFNGSRHALDEMPPVEPPERTSGTGEGIGA